MAKASSFIADIPVGYVGLDEALPLIAVTDVAFATWLARCISPLPGIPVERAWSRRDMAISLLATALRSANLVGLVRDSVSGELFRLTASDWCNLGLWRDTIISGMVQTSVGDALERHAGRRVLLEASAFEAWRGQIPELQHHLRAVDLVGGTPEIGTPTLTTKSNEMSVDKPVDAPAKRSRRRQRSQGPQTRRARFILNRMFSHGFPTEEQLPNQDLIKRFNAEYWQTIKDGTIEYSELGQPSEEVVLRVVGRKT
jgi:hypothetical protein